MRSGLVRSFTSIGALALAAQVLPAQFIAHPPAAPPPAEARRNEARQGFTHWLPDAPSERLRARALRLAGAATPTDAERAADQSLATELGSLVQAYCAERWPNSTTECRQSLATDTILSWREGKAPRITRTFLPFRLPFTHRRDAVLHYLRLAADSSATPRLLGQFSAAVSTNEAFVITDLISGVAGRTLIAVSYAAVVVKSDTGSASVRDTIETDKARLLRMLNAGGTVTLRAAVPMHARGGPTFRHASMAVMNLGLVGPLGREDSLAPSGSVALEYAGALTIRDREEEASPLGDLVFAARVGFAASGKSLLLGTDLRSFEFAQVGIGLRQGNTTGISALVTFVGDPSAQRIMPRLLVNFSAIR